MSKIADDLNQFVAYAKLLKGDEKGEAQVFCDRLFQAFGHKGYKEAGATLEERIKKASGKGTSFADLVWKPRVLIEMKKAGEKLHLHYNQAFDYWLNAVPDRPRYVILCNFSEFWIYDFDRQLNDPVDVVKLQELPTRYTALNFLFADERKPIFNNDREDVSRRTADNMASLFKALTRRPKNPIPRTQAQRFILQLMVAMFAEDIDLLPSGTVVTLVDDCLNKGQSSYDLFNGLFQQMNTPKRASAGRFRDVRYFNGGLFAEIEAVELSRDELELIGGKKGAATENWAKINPIIFGTLFQQSMDAEERHALGAHFTSEADIQRIIGPTIVKPWVERIDSAVRLQDLVDLRRQLMEYRVFDPACGSGNFLYMAYRELARLDLRLLARMEENFSARSVVKQSLTASIISPKKFFGFDVDAFGVELTKVTLMLAKKLALNEALAALGRDEVELGFYDGLPLDNLDDNIKKVDALFTPWPEVDTVIGNPPFQSKNKMQEELGAPYLHRLREAHPDVPGHADYCVYWLRLTHDHLKDGQRAGLVGTNTVRQNYSREGGLDYIVSEGGTITEAVSSMPWSGDADVHVSIINWVKGAQPGAKRLYIQEGSDPSAGWHHEDREIISSALSYGFDVTKATSLLINSQSDACSQGQTHGHKAFLLKPAEAKTWLASDKKYADVIFPFLIANTLFASKDGLPDRYVIDFGDLDVLSAKKYPLAYERIEASVLPERKKKAAEESERNKKTLEENASARVNRHHGNFLNQWWRMSYRRADLMKTISRIDRYIACGQVTKRPIFEFISNKIHPNAQLIVFPRDDDYSFGILQSSVHWSWFTERCSTLTERYRYTSNSVFDSFPWPQSPTIESVKAVATAARKLRAVRRDLCSKHELSLRELYRSVELPGNHPLDVAQDALDAAVRKAYGMKPKANPLKFLFDLNQQLAELERQAAPIVGPGLPAAFEKVKELRSDDCLSMT
ncbi:DNA methyltransferase [Afipia sp. GAS231]|uniref:DNA methyltransferase n=1 Tax=Afipia sp. GAS231 TaxID=1882747 RepID=UPI0008795307|nr:DNA methyltransferase [Afipia sp. GAS231]SDO24643.1 Type II restriction/modification system, DNA methylase subunit YeeA [Afipia sp. GAS231]